MKLRTSFSFLMTRRSNCSSLILQPQHWPQKVSTANTSPGSSWVWRTGAVVWFTSTHVSGNSNPPEVTTHNCGNFCLLSSRDGLGSCYTRIHLAAFLLNQLIIGGNFSGCVFVFWTGPPLRTLKETADSRVLPEAVFPLFVTFFVFSWSCSRSMPGVFYPTFYCVSGSEAAKLGHLSFVRKDARAPRHTHAHLALQCTTNLISPNNQQCTSDPGYSRLMRHV